MKMNKPMKKIEQGPTISQVVLSRKRPFRQGAVRSGVSNSSPPRESFVMYLGPKARRGPGVERPSASPGDGGPLLTISRTSPGAYASASRGRIRRNPAGLNAVVRVEPGHPVVHNLENGYVGRS